MRVSFYILVDIDLHPDLANAYDGVEKIGITADNSRKGKPIIYIQGKGKAGDGCPLSFEAVYKYSFFKHFERLNLIWVLDFLRENPNFTEEQLKQEIVSHGLKLITEEY
ncbi:hypothetical protein [Gilliamella intestini]|uniref:Uncharacterized protein n=1 Tax=Gilliamella intestini TaxID=1798183 RepID=A0A1C4D1L8_9GAMM|nr:hypothetical protein [Gilliamella intestini]SCC25219.1 hypothetical protein GA0061080_105616 [Gilliamella intestini]